VTIGRRAAMALLALLPSTTRAESPAMTLAEEIEHLIAFIRNSPCVFIRNGAEYDGATAADHVRQKYEYYRDRDRIHSVEDFIDLAATRSALSGKPYRIRCPGKPAGPAADWLRAELPRIRAETGGD
jgi:hypothetical protein